MELKDVILSTLDEIEKDSKKDDLNLKKHIESYKQNAPIATGGSNSNEDVAQDLELPPFLRNQEEKASIEQKDENSFKDEESKDTPKQEDTSIGKDHTQEIKYLETMREKLLVLFEGFQSPNNNNIEAKLDLTVNFLEYILSTLDERLDKLKKE
ncbi:MAG: CiaD-like domain-containing protein [Campylobacterota bacterium]